MRQTGGNKILHIQTQRYVPWGLVVCLHLADREPEPNLANEENAWTKHLIGFGQQGYFYACKRDGTLYNQTPVNGVFAPLRLSPPPETRFIPVEQFSWEQVLRMKEGKFIVYSPYGYPLERIDYGGRGVTFRSTDGTETLGKSYSEMLYDARSRNFEHEYKSLWRENTESILQEFVSDINCSIGDLVFVPHNSRL